MQLTDNEMTPEEMHSLAKKYLNGNEEEVKEALALYQKAAQSGLTEAQFEYGQLLIKAPYYDYKNGFFWLEYAAKENHLPALLLLAKCYKEGYAVGIRPTRVLKYLKAAADMGDSASCDEVALMYFNGCGTIKNVVLAKKYALQCEEAALPNSQYILGILLKREGQEDSFKRAAQYFERSASAGCAAAKYQLYLMYGAGCGVEKDGEKAQSFLEEAAECGYRPAVATLKKLTRNR